MRLLLDTHIWIWMLTDPDRIRPRVSHAVRSPDNELWLSPISLWELAMLVERRRIDLDRDVDAWCANAAIEIPTREAAITHEIVLQSRRVDVPQQDPADRFLAATAKILDLTLVTADERLLRSKEFAVLANR